MKYKGAYDFAEKTVNKIPFVKNMNIKVIVGEHSISYRPIAGECFCGGYEITASFMDHLGGIIDGLVYAYKELKEV